MGLGRFPLITLEKEGVPLSKFLSRFRKNEDGASLVEYAVLIALLAVFLILTIQGLGITINSKFSAVNNMLANP